MQLNPRWTELGPAQPKLVFLLYCIFRAKSFETKFQYPNHERFFYEMQFLHFDDDCKYMITKNSDKEMQTKGIHASFSKSSDRCDHKR